MSICLGYLKINAAHYISENNKELELEELLRSINAVDLLERFRNVGINVDDLIKLDANDLNFFAPLDRAEQLHRDIQKEIERRIRLLQKLKDVKCDDLYNRLLKIGYTSEKGFSTNHDTLISIGLSFLESTNVLEKIQSKKDEDIRGNQLLWLYSMYQLCC